MPSNYLILCRPLLILPSIFPSIRVSSNESTLRMRWPKYWSFSLSISPSNEYSLISFRTNWFDLLAVQGTLKVKLLCPRSSLITSINNEETDSDSESLDKIPQLRYQFMHRFQHLNKNFLKYAEVASVKFECP